jgi:hypothetical protein
MLHIGPYSEPLAPGPQLDYQTQADLKALNPVDFVQVG